MTATHETNPYRGEPDAFDLIAGELQEQLTDPYTETIHHQAHLCEEALHELDPSGNAPALRAEYITYLDTMWRYHTNPLIVTGKIWLKNPTTDEIYSEMLIGETVFSHGFSFAVNGAVTGTSGHAKAAHCVEVARDGQSRMGLILIDDLFELTLPYPSPEMRERRFAYYHPDKAGEIDEHSFTVPRADQIFRSYGELIVDVDTTDPSGQEDRADAEQYLRSKVSLEPMANYEVCILGDVLVQQGFALVPHAVTKLHTRTLRIQDIRLCPADVYDQHPNGQAAYTPYVYAVAFNPDDTDTGLFIPCRSITAIRSLRYPDFA